MTHKRLETNSRFMEFSPNLNDKSKKMMKDRPERAYKRLHKHANQKEERMEKLKNKLERDMFRPMINQNSRDILRKKKEQDFLVKTDNGKTENLDFFYAAPPHKHKNFYTLDSKRINRRSKSKQKPKQEISKFSLTKLMKGTGDARGRSTSKSKPRRRRARQPKGKQDPK